jgi:HK97 family phage portal protein
MGYNVNRYGGGNAMVEACISAYAQTVSMCPGDHWRKLPNGGRERVIGSALTRILKRPNDYQSISDFMLNLTRRLYSTGEVFAFAVRNNRSEISELHLMQNGYYYVATDGSIFYHLAGNEIVESRFDLSLPIPARDVLHIRLHTPRHPLKGESPIMAATLDLAMSGAALSQQIAYYINEARPSFLLETDEKLTKEQADALRARWNEQTQGEMSGGTPILSWGLKAKPVQGNARDAQLVEMLKMTDQNIALAFRIPLQVLGVGDTPFASTEALMSAWKSSGLGFALNHIEEAFGQFFRLAGVPDEYMELDTNALLRSSFKELMDALAVGTRRIMTANEARMNYLDLPHKPGGDEILVQEQDIPLSMAGMKQAAAVAALEAPQAPVGENANDESQRANFNLVGAFRASHARSLAA